MNKTKIEWCDITWNPVWGCLNHCSFCYAEKIAKRFGSPNGRHDFKPEWVQSNFDKKFPKKPSIIFVNSMSDISCWKLKWMEKVLNKIEKYPQHKFLFLTKDTYYYSVYKFPDNCWLGATYISHTHDRNLPINFDKSFISFEPLIQRVNVENIKYFNWVIIGAETGNRRLKIIPKKQWVAEIVDYCKENKTPVFMKNNLQQIWNKKLIQEFPRD